MKPLLNKLHLHCIYTLNR